VNNVIRNVEILFLSFLILFVFFTYATAENYSYKIIKVNRLGNIKCSITVRLSHKVSEDTLRQLAIKLHDKEPKKYDRMFITYYLPGMTIGAGAWATTHFNPNLDVRILGMTKETQSIKLHDYGKVVLKRGDTGKNVKILQGLLNAHGFECTISGTFDRETMENVKAFQVQNNMKADGIVGKKTWKALSVSNKQAVEKKSVAQSKHSTDQSGRLNSFLSLYCKTYESKDLNKFSGFFAPGATENNKAFNKFLPRYRRNFEIIKSFNYRIDLGSYSLMPDTGITKVKGKYTIRFLYNGELKENTGHISMELIESGDTYLIKSLNYTSPSKE
jgi:Putative peptidoglycan binding domain